MARVLRRVGHRTSQSCADDGDELCGVAVGEEST